MVTVGLILAKFLCSACENKEQSLTDVSSPACIKRQIHTGLDFEVGGKFLKEVQKKLWLTKNK